MSAGGVEAIAALVAAVAALVTVGLVWRQVVVAKRAQQGETLLSLMLALQTTEVVCSTKALYEYRRKGLSGEDLLAHRNEIEPAIRVLETVGVLAKYEFLPRDVLMREWGGMVRDVWSASEGFVKARREKDGQPYLWESLEWLAMWRDDRG